MTTEIRPDLLRSFQETWNGIAAPGATWSGRERVAIAAEVRRARSGQDTGSALDPTVAKAARTVAARPSSIRKDWVEGLVADGVGHGQYVELIGVVSRVVAVDTFHGALGLALNPLPEAMDGNPTGAIDGRARLNNAWVPMVGGASITQALSLVPFENAELERQHGPLYLSFEEMSDPLFVRGLTRPQMELVAARTSALNECFY